MNRSLAWLIIVVASLGSLSQTFGEALAGTGAPSGEFRAVGDVVEKLGLVAALVIAVRYLALRTEAKDAALLDKDKMILEKDDAFINALETVVKSNTEALTSFQQQVSHLTGAMREVNDKLIMVTTAIDGIWNEKATAKPSQSIPIPLRGDGGTGQIPS